MKKNIFIGIFVAAAFSFVIFFLWNSDRNSEEIKLEPRDEVSLNMSEKSAMKSGENKASQKTFTKGDAGNIVEVSSSGFSPAAITVKAGDLVVFVNKDREKHWPASDIHPIHEKYPGSGVSKCGTKLEQGIFDACEGLSFNETYKFVFKEKGSWTYHDHLNPFLKGVIKVE